MTSEEVKEEQVFIIPPGYNIEAHVAKLTDRTCGDCQMCCKFTGIEALRKPRGLMCKHAVEHRCSIYSNRPEPCRTFHCFWRLGGFEEEARPDKIGVFLFFKRDEDGITWGQIVICQDGKQPITLEKLLILDNIIRGFADGMIHHFAIYRGRKVLIVHPDGVYEGETKRNKGEFESEEVLNMKKIADSWDLGLKRVLKAP